MLNNLSQLDSSDLKGHIFIGTVVANNDTLQAERIKVTIPGIFENADLRLLPWVGRKDGGPIANQASTHGSFGLVPRVGDKVFVMFQQGNAQYPLYWKSPITAGSRPAEALVNYPNRYGWKDPAGNVFFVDTTAGQRQIKITHFSGTSITIANNGKVTIDSKNDLDLLATGNVLIRGTRVDINP